MLNQPEKKSRQVFECTCGKTITVEEKAGTKGDLKVAEIRTPTGGRVVQCPVCGREVGKRPEI